MTPKINVRKLLPSDSARLSILWWLAAVAGVGESTLAEASPQARKSIVHSIEDTGHNPDNGTPASTDITVVTASISWNATSIPTR